MRITTKSKIALDILLTIAAHTAKGYAIGLPIISKRLGVSHSYLELIFSSLKSAGLVHSHRGPGGGYSLAKEPEAISLKDIISATGGTEPLESGLSTQLWVNLDAHMQNHISQIPLSQILANTKIELESNLEQLQVKLERGQKIILAVSVQPPPKKRPPSFGPSSVFSFGKYLLKKK